MLLQRLAGTAPGAKCLAQAIRAKDRVERPESRQHSWLGPGECSCGQSARAVPGEGDSTSGLQSTPPAEAVGIEGSREKAERVRLGWETGCPWNKQHS